MTTGGDGAYSDFLTRRSAYQAEASVAGFDARNCGRELC